eukprot:TRINITY_DN4260_c0_g1_i1.p1 TRINITY_DN4260_c0_g1~~TRINITY_DN4260_c0_g1_i1.p1  ORF type:complete len:518 (-),score=114.20 TRINITY_DN4260_c0_g1_i1:27-1559(-)
MKQIYAIGAVFSILVFFTLLLIQSPSTSTSDTYTAAVVELVPIKYTGKGTATLSEARTVMNKNLDQFEGFIQAAVKRHAQIIVFPENGITGNGFKARKTILPFLETIPDPHANLSQVIIPCKNAEFTECPILSRLSCLAKKYSIHIVANVGDVQPCSKHEPACPSDGRYQYNTLVAFSDYGRLIGRYHKIHLYNEQYFDSAAVPRALTFETTFGVTFGMMVCFDLSFGFPSSEYRRMGVKDIVYSANWVNLSPFQTAVEVQSGWSRFFDAKLLASGVGKGMRSSGSGIYQSGQALSYIFNPMQITGGMVLAKVPIEKGSRVIDQGGDAGPIDSSGGDDEFDPDIPVEIFDNDEDSRYEPFVAYPGTSKTITGTSGNITCTVSYTVSDNKVKGAPESYILIIWQGDKIKGALPAPFAYCGIQRCSGSKKGICNSASLEGLKASTVFTSLHISGDFDSTRFSPLPVAATNGALPFEKEDLEFTTSPQLASLKTSPDFKKIILNAGILSYLSR